MLGLYCYIPMSLYTYIPISLSVSFCIALSISISFHLCLQSPHLMKDNSVSRVDTMHQRVKRLLLYYGIATTLSLEI